MAAYILHLPFFSITIGRKSAEMSRQRYDQVPQHDIQSPITLSQIQQPIPQHQPQTYTYNYNTGLPASLPASSRASISSLHHPQAQAPPSIPASPPPSFHTHSSPGTPRPTPSTRTTTSIPRSYAAELWGVAPSTVGGETETTIGTSNDALATIAGLKQRVEWLEESIGRLLLEKEQNKEDTTKPSRDNCCVRFTDASPDLERALVSGRGSNCCVFYRGNNHDAKREKRRHAIVFAIVALFLVCVMMTIVLTSDGAKDRMRESGIPGMGSRPGEMQRDE